MTDQQKQIWYEIVKDCNSEIRSVNVGSKKRRDAINAVNAFLRIHDVVVRSEQLVCDICEEPLEKVLGRVCENTMCHRHRY